MSKKLKVTENYDSLQKEKALQCMLTTMNILRREFWAINEWCCAHLDEDLSNCEERQRDILNLMCSISDYVANEGSIKNLNYVLDIIENCYGIVTWFND